MFNKICRLDVYAVENPNVATRKFVIITDNSVQQCVAIRPIYEENYQNHSLDYLWASNQPIN